MSGPGGGRFSGVNTPLSRSATLAALVAVVGLVLGAAIYLPADTAFSQRLGIVTMIAAVVIPALVAAVRGDKSATVSEHTKSDTGRLINGELQGKIEATVHRALIDHDHDVHGLEHPLVTLPLPGNKHAEGGLTPD